MNDDTYEEVVTFKLSRLSVYVMLSSIFVLLVGLTVALIVFTPLKYYIPGFNDLKGGRELREMKYQVDEMNNRVRNLEQYNAGLIRALSDKQPVQRDTTILNVPRPEADNR
jgi:hypothetical protein